MQIREQSTITFMSRPYRQCMCMVTVSLATSLAWLMVMFCISTTIAALQHFLPLAALLSLLMLLAVSYLNLLSHQLIMQSKQNHRFTLTDDLICVTAFDELKNVQVNQQIQLRDVVSAQYCSQQRSASLRLCSGVSCIEIPLWSFAPDHERAIVSLIMSRRALNGSAVPRCPE